MKRITPELVKEAYAKTGLKPAQRKFYGRGCACAIGATYCGTTGEAPNAHEAYSWAEIEFGAKYADGFIQGFDGKMLDSEESDYKQGFEDGRAAFAAVRSDIDE